MSAVQGSSPWVVPQLGWTELVSIRVESNPEFGDEEYEGELTVSLEIESTGKSGSTPNGRTWLVDLLIKLDGRTETEGQQPYEIGVHLRGLFVTDEPLLEDEVSIQLAPFAGAVLYGAARELLLGLTGRCSYGPFQLPEFDFTSLHQDGDPSSE